MQAHEICEIFPAMEGEEFKGLLADIATHGQREPIWLFEGKVLDGRNRHRACRELGIEPAARAYEGDDPVGFAVSLNLKRRHLTESQRAMIADRLANLGEGRPKTMPIGVVSPRPVSRAKAAGMLGVSERSVARAHKVNEQASPKLKEAVEKGRVHVSAAADVSGLPEAEQEAAVAKGPEAIKEKAKEVRKGKSRVNGVVQDDPPDVADLRAKGKIPAGAVPDVSTAAREPGEDDEEPRKEPDDSALDDGKWLASLPSRKAIEPACLPTFDADALLYRTLEQPRKTFANHAARAAGKARRKAYYAYYLNRFLKFDHPRHWLRCPPPAADSGAGCGGGGYLEFDGKRQQCPKCFGRGYWINHQ